MHDAVGGVRHDLPGLRLGELLLILGAVSLEKVSDIAAIAEEGVADPLGHFVIMAATLSL